MDVPDDILFEIAVRTNDSSLVELYVLPRFRDRIREMMMSSSLFWYVRSKKIVGIELEARPNADWKTIYYSLLAAKEKNNPHAFGMHDLDSLLILVEVYGPIAPSARRLWFQVRSPEVLQYLLDSDCLKYNIQHAGVALRDRILNDDVEMAKALIALLIEDLTRYEVLRAIESSIVSNKSIEITKLWLGVGDCSEDELYDLLKTAIDKKNTEAIHCIMNSGLRELDRSSYITKLRNEAVNDIDREAMRILDPDFGVVWLPILDRSIRDGKLNRIEYALSRSIFSFTNKKYMTDLLIQAAHSGHEFFSLLLEHPEFDPMELDLSNIIRHIVSSISHRGMLRRILRNSPKFRPGKLTPEQAQLLYGY
jgi:hypothetical protein